MAKKQEYGNESITSLKGADRVRKRPAVIFGSDGVEGCAHSIFEIVSNSIDEARDGHGDTINVTRCKDGSVIVEDFGRGMPVDWNNGEGRYNWAATTGSCCSVRCMQAASMARVRITTSSALA